MSEIEKTPESIEAEIAALQAEEAALKAAEVTPAVIRIPSAQPVEPQPAVERPRHIIRPAGQTVPAAAPLQPLAR